MLPYVHSDQRWISEGFAQYYQNVLLARSGSYTEQFTWQKLHDGLQRGLESAPAMSPNEAASTTERDTRMKVYWSGAALALLADIELRQRSGGEESLDDVLDRFERCCLPSARILVGSRASSGNLDSPCLRSPLFMPNCIETHAETPGFPDVWPPARTARRHSRVQTGSYGQTCAQLAAIRRAMTAP